MRAGIYARISKDSEGTELGVTRQQEDCRREADRRGWEVVDIYVDNDVSATRSRSRPSYERMMSDVRAGRIEAVVVWAVDRLTRSPRELEDIIDMADRHGLALANVGGSIDLATPEGRAMARQMGTFARLEVENMSKRLRRKFQDKASKGEPHGRSPYGYRRVEGRDVPVEAQASVIREAAQRVLAGESLRSIVTDFNGRGIHGPEAELWNSTILRQILKRSSNAGLRQYQGKIVGPSTTEPILDTPTFDRLFALLTDPSRRSNHVGPGFKYLLSGLALCGRCGGPMRRQVGRTSTTRSGGKKRQPPAYVCEKCFLRRQQARVDEVVTAAIIDRLGQPDAIQLAATGDAEVARAAQAALAGIDAKLDIVADQFAADEITGEQLKRITARLRTERENAQRQLAASMPNERLMEVTKGDVASWWDTLPLGAQREILDALATVTILPTGPGHPFDPESVLVRWKTG